MFSKKRPQACNFIKKDTLAQVFSYEFCEIFKNTFFTEHVRATTFEVTKAEKNFWELSTEKPSAMSMPSSPCFSKAYLTEFVFTRILRYV